jgi:hypothetical protein
MMMMFFPFCHTILYLPHGYVDQAVVIICLFALGVVVLDLVELVGPDGLCRVSIFLHDLCRDIKHTSDCCDEMFCLKCSESGPLCPSCALLSVSAAVPVRT